MSSPILVVDQVLTAVAGEPSQQLLRDYLLSMVFANAAARAARNNAAADAEAQDFASEWSNQLGNLGWVITQAGSARISFAGSQTTTVADQVALQAGGPGIENGLTALKSLVSSRTDEVQALTDMFWNAAADGDVLVGSIGQVSAGPDGPAFELATFTLPLDRLAVSKPGLLGRKTAPLAPTSPAAFFVEVDADSVDLSVSHISASLRADLFAAKRDDLIAKLGDRVEAHYRALPSDLVTAAP